MGIPGDFENPEFKTVLKEIFHVAKETKIPSGIHIVEPSLKELRNKFREGFKLIAYSVDFRILDVAFRSALSTFKDLK